MLRRMLGTSGDGQHDRLMDFTQAVSGAHFFAPSLEVLTSLLNLIKNSHLTSPLPRLYGRSLKRRRACFHGQVLKMLSNMAKRSV